MNINCSSADSLSLKTRVRLYDECVEVGGEGGKEDKGCKAVRRVAACCVARTTTKKSRTLIGFGLKRRLPTLPPK